MKKMTISDDSYESMTTAALISAWCAADAAVKFAEAIKKRIATLLLSRLDKGKHFGNGADAVTVVEEGTQERFDKEVAKSFMSEKQWHSCHYRTTRAAYIKRG